MCVCVCVCVCIKEYKPLFYVRKGKIHLFLYDDLKLPPKCFEVERWENISLHRISPVTLFLKFIIVDLQCCVSFHYIASLLLIFKF